MSTLEVNGGTPDELEDLRSEFMQTQRGEAGVPFEDAFCLLPIPKQPEDYEGPQRYCQRWTAKDRTDVCPHHTQNVDNLISPVEQMESGITALRKNLKADFDEAEEQAWEAIVEEWSDYYDIEAPGSIETLESMAIELVRETRADQVLEEYRESNPDQGITKVKEVYGPEGGVQGTEDVPNYVFEERRKTRRQIQSMKDDLGITRKHQDKLDVAEEAAGINEVANEVDDALSGEHEYDPNQFTGDDEDEEEQ